MSSSRNIKQIYDTNPITSNEDDDLAYWGRYPYRPNLDNKAIKYKDLKENILAGITPNMPVVVVTASTQQLEPNKRYYVNRPSLVMLQMPVTSSVGDKIEIINMNNAWQISQPDGMNIRLLNKITTTGAAGYIASANVGETIILECVTENDLWFASDAVGNFTVA